MTAERVRVQHCHSLTSNIAGLQRGDRFCDVDIHVDGKVFKCHRLILSAASNYFDNMFNGTFKESTEKEVTLEGIEANVFEVVLEFMYTGNAMIDCPKVCDMIRAADFYSLPSLMELCTEVVEKNLNALANDILKLYSLVHHIRCTTELVELLSRHIHENFLYFSRRPEFGELTYAGIVEFLTRMKVSKLPPFTQDVFVDGIEMWISQQVFSSPTEKKACLDDLMDRIDFNKLSVEYIRRRVKRSVEEETFSPRKKSRKALRTADDKFLHACVSRIGSNGSMGVSVFTAHVTRNISIRTCQLTWVYSGELKCPIDYMRNVDIDGFVYSLRYARYALNLQTFSCGSSVLMYPFSTLKPPPCILEKFDLCGAQNNIYAYDRSIVERPIPIDTDSSGFTREKSSRGVFVYKRDIDRWFPLPSPASTKVCDACMTCDDEGIVYLIGGRESNRSVRVYDQRTEGWSTLSSTRGEYVSAACCVYGKKLFVAGGINNPRMVETYVDGEWTRVKDLPEPRIENFQLMNWFPQLEKTHKLITFSNQMQYDLSILCSYSNLDKVWYSMPNLFKAVRKTYLTYINLKLLDIINIPY